MTIDEAHQQYDDCMFCQCYTNWIEKKAQQILKNSKKDERRVLTGVVLTSLAGAAIFYIAVDEVRKDMAGAHHHWAGNNRNRLSHGRSQK